MLSEIVRNSSFKAEELMVRKGKGWTSLRISDDRRKVQEKIGEATYQKMDFLPVSDHGTVAGYIAKSDLLSSNWIKEVIPTTDIPEIRENCEIPELVKVFERNIQKIGLYFVYKDQKITGLINYSDLNRKSVYVYLYLRLVALEQGFRKKFKKVYADSIDSDLIESLSKHLSKRRAKNISSELTNESIFSQLNLSEFIRIIETEPDMKDYLSSFKGGFLNIANKVRIRIAHPTKLLVPKKSTLEAISMINKFLDGTRTIIIDNEKNR